jgi:DNA segregation ATPase FtsK/SpoIIIE, S-DNA-T family
MSIVMATKKRKKKAKEIENYTEIIKWIVSIACIALGLILELGGIGVYVGNLFFSFAYGIIGIAAFIIPVGIILLGVGILLKRTFLTILEGFALALMILSSIVFLGITTNTVGGSVGTWAGSLMVHFFGFIGGLILVCAIALVGLGLLVDLPSIARNIQSFLYSMLERFQSGGTFTNTTKEKDGGTELGKNPLKKLVSEQSLETLDKSFEARKDADPTITMFNGNERASAQAIPNIDVAYNPPPLSLLGADSGKPGVGDIKANANIIKRTFLNFGISVEMDEVSVGPTVTRYAIKPAEGVRLSKIISLQNNLELALASHPVRIEAPIPGKSLVGIEVPNASKAMVGLGGVLSAPEWSSSPKPILAAIGRDITGTPHYTNIAKMPHGLIAGATGSGKSVAIHAVITSLLYRNGPNQLRFIMVDPKRVELTLYNGIPHLLTPVITDPKKCIMSLKWAAKEMDRRYGILESEQVRDIDSYHKTVVEVAKKKNTAKDEMPEAMPYIVIVIDELADIMQSYPRELEASIVRLAQMSRAVGIHLILSTQRPSVNVITGLIKANVPTRMALQVSSQIDSRTILDTGGAELLLGGGDMLYMGADMQKPIRLQTAYISESEVKKVAQYIKQHNVGTLASIDLGNGTGAEGNTPNDAILSAGSMFSDDMDNDGDDDLYMDAKAAVEEAGKASTSYIQRKLRVGYSRAARLMDLLEQNGIIGPADGSRPRDVLSGRRDAQAVEIPEKNSEDADKEGYLGSV